jgi:hypothetical protein
MAAVEAGARVGVADRYYTRDLYSLLGIGRHVSAEELRYAYEQAMSAATRSGNLSQAGTLLAAYEALATPRRQKVFGRTFDGSPSATTPLPAPRPADGPPRRRPPRPKKWGMSLPIRVLAFGVIVPLTIFAMVQAQLHPSHVANYASAGPQAPPGEVATIPLLSVQPADAALYVERRNGRADVTCTFSGATGGLAQFACQASDGQSWAVSGTSPANLSAVVTSPSVFLQSARFDAQATANALTDCLKVSDDLPESSGPQTVHATLTCGGGVLTMYLRPGDSLDYIRTGTDTYRLTVVASDGETVNYDSKTNQYQ